MKLYIGCGDKKLAGYVNIDIVPTEGSDLVMDVGKELYRIPSDTAIEIRMDSAFEHFYRYQQKEILQEFRRILKKDGTLVINWLPDFDAIVDVYLKQGTGITGKTFDLFDVYRLTHGDPTPLNSPQQLHKDIFTKKSIRLLLENNGFQIKHMTNEIFPQEKHALNINLTAKPQINENRETRLANRN